MIRVAVLGLGNFGFHFARRVAQQKGVDVLAVDIEKETVAEVGQFATNVVVADVTQREVLEELDVGSVDYAVISLGGSMDASVLATLHVRSLGVPNIYVKATSDDHARILQLIGATKIIHPEREVAESLAEALGKPNVLEFIPLGEDHSIIEFEPPSSMVGKSLSNLDLRNRYGVTVIGVREYLTDRRNMNPSGDYIIGDDVTLLILGRKDQLESLRRAG